MNREEKIKEFEAKAKEYFVLAKDLQRQLDELKSEPVLDIGKWYIGYNDGCHYLTVWNKGSDTYGFFEGYWGYNWVFSDDIALKLRPATPEEVEAALIKEAKRRGFKEGVRIEKDLHDGMECKLIDEDFELVDGMLLTDFGDCIFYNGKWAEIITEPKVMVNGYEMEQEGDIIKFGCARFYKEFFIETLNKIKWLNNSSNFQDVNSDLQNRNIDSIMLDSGVEITVEQLKEIVDNIK